MTAFHRTMRFLFSAMCALACAATSLAFAPSAAAVSWSETADLSLPGQNAYRPEVAAGPDGLVHAAWVRFDGTNDRVETARFTGTEWSEAVILSGAGDAEYPQITVDADGRAIAVWRRKVDSTNWQIEASRFDGTSWGSAVALSSASTTTTLPTLAMNSTGDAILAWVRATHIEARLYTPGAGWGLTTALTSSGTNTEPDVAIDANGDTTVVWHSDSRTGGEARYEVLAKNYDGTNWSTVAVLDKDGSSAFQQPRVATNAAGVAVATWTHTDALHAAMYDGSAWLNTGGGSPQSYVQLVSPASNDASTPQVVVDPSGFGTMIWGNLPVSGNPGVSARTPFVSLVSTGSTTSVAASASMLNPRPQLSLESDGQPRAVWERASGSTTVIQTSRFGGANWTTATTLSDATQNAAYPQIAIGPDGVTTVVWQRSNGVNTIIQATRWPIPNAPTGAVATILAGGRASIAFSADPMTGLPDNTVGISGNTATCTSSDGGATRTGFGASSPVVVSDLTPGKTYTCSVVSSHAAGPSATSGATAAFLSGYALAVTSLNGNGTITDDTGQMNCNVACTTTQVDGSTVNLTATPAAGWSFGSWGGSCEGALGRTCTVSMSQARDVVVTFIQDANPSEPGAPGGVVATAGLRSAAISWVAPASDGGSAITTYTATAIPGGATCTSSSTRCTIDGLLNTTAYTFTVAATNAVGSSSTSAVSAAVRPYARLKMKKPRASGGQLVSLVRVTGAATITQTASTTAGKRACREIVRARQKGSIRVMCSLERGIRKELKKRALTVNVTTAVLTKKGASFQATKTVRITKSR